MHCIPRPRRVGSSSSWLLLLLLLGAAPRMGVAAPVALGSRLERFIDAIEPVGDEIERGVTWKRGRDASRFAGQVVRWRFVLRDAELDALRFR